jgi:hypothetical protein
MIEYISFKDIIILPLMLIIFYILAVSIKNKNIESNPYYKFFVPALFIKIFGGISVCLVYLYYYSFGDTLVYYHDNVCLSDLFMKNPIGALKYTFLDVNQQILTLFDTNSGYPTYAFDKNAVYVTKITWVLSLITFNSYLGQTLLLSFLSFFPVWRMYKAFLMEFPALGKELAYAILFIPSVVFWGSGLLKDTLTFMAACLFVSSFYQIIKLKRKYFLNILFLIIASWILIRIKPYILFAMLPGTFIWFTNHYLETVKNKLIRVVIRPAFIAITVLIGFLFLKNMGDSLSNYSIDKVLYKAVEMQQDLKQDYYHGSSFDIGDFDPTFRGVLAKSPIAIISALFRPFLWESYNPGMIVSGVENFIILIFTIYLLIRLKIYNLFKLLFKNPLLFFSISFSLFFAFAVGLSTSNFGALVRYKIPAIPFFVASLIIINFYYREKRRDDLEKEKTATNTKELVPVA